LVDLGAGLALSKVITWAKDVVLISEAANPTARYFLMDRTFRKKVKRL
jgi:hypothetical protein